MATTAVPVKRMPLGSQGLEVSSQGLGCATLAGTGYMGSAPDEGDMIQLVQHAVRRGVTFLDTADVYGGGTSETLVGKVRLTPLH
jgi:aryl-alcohol dehydrogenase-like predicted oxidoreductase